MKTEAKKTEYITRKAKVAAINRQISEKNAEIKELKMQIDETQSVIQSTQERLKIEEREVAIPGPLSKRSMSIEEYRDQKAHLADWQKDVSKLHDDLAILNQDLAFLQTDLAREQPYLFAARSEIVAAMVDDSLEEFNAIAGESLKKLVLAIIARAGKNSGFSQSQRQAFQDATYKAICEKILPGIFQDCGLPDLSEANNFITEAIERKAA